MIFNVAQFLKSPIGISMTSDIHEEDVQLDNDLKLVGPIDGQVRMRRINQGILVDGWVELTLDLTCTRCLKEFEQNLRVSLDERFNPTVDIVTGLPLPPIEEEDVFPINDHHEIDLTEAIRQRIWLEVPMVTLCKEECAGLCPQCGKDLNEGPCGCEPEEDTRMSILKTLLQDKLQS